MKRVVRCAFMVALLLALASGVARATPTVLDFDTLGSDQPIPSGYGGFDWNNFYTINGSVPNGGKSGYHLGTVSSPNVAYNAYGNPASISWLPSGPITAFNFIGAYFTSAWNDNLQLQVQGFLGGTQEYSNTLTLSPQSPMFGPFVWTNITELTFNVLSVGNVHWPWGVGGGAYFVMDNFTFEPYTAVPEPISMIFFGTGLATVWGYIARRRMLRN